MIQKFRFVETAKKKMHEVLSVHLMTSMVEVVGGKYFLIPQDGILMQSTGLFDKNAKEIFEGDIVEYSLRLGCSGKGEVIFDEDYGWFNIDGFDAEIYDYPTLAFSEGTDNFEVIGNIHQHQHLLED